MTLRYPKSVGLATAFVHTIFQVKSLGNDRLNQKLPTTKLFNQLTYKTKTLTSCNLVSHFMWY